MVSVPELRRTDAGTGLVLMPSRSGGRAATVLLLSSTAPDTLTTEPYRRFVQPLHEQGWAVVSMGLPCHDDDRRPGEPSELFGWAARTARGEDFVAAFCRQAREVVDYLLAQGTADPARLAVAGTSRAGFLAFHAAAADARLKAVAAICPVTDLRTLTEFAGQEHNPLLERLALVRVADALAGRPVWIIIGNADQRVGTDKATAFAEALTAAALARGLRGQVTLRLADLPGHRSLPRWHEDAAAWLGGLEFAGNASGR